MLNSYEKNKQAPQAIKILWRGEGGELLDPDTGDTFSESENDKHMIRVIIQKY